MEDRTSYGRIDDVDLQFAYGGGVSGHERSLFPDLEDRRIRSEFGGRSGCAKCGGTGGISISYIWVETAAYLICAVLLFLFFRVEDNLKAEQDEIECRNKEKKAEI